MAKRTTTSSSESHAPIPAGKKPDEPSGQLPEARTKLTDTEKITINLGLIDLGQIDLLVQEGFYSNRTDLIRTAIRNQLLTHGEVLRQSVARRTLVLGLQEFSRRDLEAVRKSRTKLRIH